jgi:hypothetical protein
MSNIIKYLLAGENLNNYVAETLFGLIKIYNPFFINLVNSILLKTCSSDQTKEKYFRMKNSFERLCSGIPQGHDYKSINSFSKMLSEFYIEINNLS